jgi:hypothetical protein
VLSALIREQVGLLRKSAETFRAMEREAVNAMDKNRMLLIARSLEATAAFAIAADHNHQHRVSISVGETSD